MAQFMIECTTSIKGDVARRFIVDADTEAAALATFRATVAYPNPRLRVWQVPDDTVQADIAIAADIVEVWPAGGAGA
jgi:hypothetical protein